MQHWFASTSGAWCDTVQFVLFPVDSPLGSFLVVSPLGCLRAGRLACGCFRSLPPALGALQSLP
eukprot:5630367-Pyramimonas_sp.AAC.1